MEFMLKFKNRFKRSKEEHLKQEKNKILEFLYEIQTLEAKLWGVTIHNINSIEEVVLEDTNHLIYLYSKGHHKNLKEILKSKGTKVFLKDLNELKKDFDNLKKKIRKKDKLKLLLSNFTIKLVDETNYENFKYVFILERILYDVLDNQDEDLKNLISGVSRMKIDIENKKVDVFLDSLKDIRRILAGHVETHDLFENERDGFSSVSNIVYELIKIFKTNIE